MSSHVIGNTGQSCNALSRMLVPKARYEEAGETSLCSAP
jgi:acyl-CoA reductase-like NAD-dependent aldehyde dehydrogenase